MHLYSTLSILYIEYVVHFWLELGIEFGHCIYSKYDLALNGFESISKWDIQMRAILKIDF